MMKKIKVLFVRPHKSSFIQKDFELLRRHFDVREVNFVLNRRNLKDTLITSFRMFMGVLWADVNYSWFADIHAFCAVRLTKLFKKKSIVVAGGYEVAKVPEIGYGLMLYPKTANMVKYVLDNADKILAVSEFNEKEILKYTKSNNVELVYNCVDYNEFKPEGIKENIAVIVGNPTNMTFKLKGIDTFVKASQAFHDVRFVVVGKYDIDIHDSLKKISSNIEFTGALSHEEVTAWLKKAKVYCQLSYRESFGMALAEAMCCECVPVVTNNSALREVVGSIGFYVPYGDPVATANVIKEALKSDKGKEARERIIQLFPTQKREVMLVNIINQIVNHK